MTHQNIDIQNYRERYLEWLVRYTQGHCDGIEFTVNFPVSWGEEREAIWQLVYQLTHSERSQEQELQTIGVCPMSLPPDPRRLPRMLDRLSALCLERRDVEPFRIAVNEAMTAYRNPEMTGGEARYINFLPTIPVFERAIPAGSKCRYPCTIEDIRRQLAFIPEYDLEGIRAIGLTHPSREDSDAYGIYYRRWYPLKAPLIVLHSVPEIIEHKLGVYNPGNIKRQHQVKLGYGMRIERRGRQAVACWSEEAIRRYLIAHTLPHEIGHHVQYQQRERARLRRWIPRHIKEQFADDYAVRFNRRRMEEQSRRISRSFGVK